MCLGFNPSSTLVATGSMDTTAKLWSVETGIEQCTLTVSKGERGEGGKGREWGDGSEGKEEGEWRVFSLRIWCCGCFVSGHIQGHSAEVICVNFSTTGDQTLTGSFDNTVNIWDTATGE